jgi:signal transduction histidine kinase
LGGFVSLASLALAVMVARRLGRRILELERRTRQIAAGNFSPMPLSRQNDELNDLSRSVNDMAGRLFHLQDEVKKNERLRLFGQVSAGLAHQLRNGVTGARLAVQLHARECTNPGDGEALSVALRQLNLLELNLKRFLQFGRPDELRSELCSLTQPVEDAIALLRHQCHHAHIDLRWNSPPVPASVRADVAQLGQLFLNLITNAMDAAGPGGWVEVTINVLQSPPNAVVEITDSGPGPAPELAERLFEPFVTGKPDGVGLGLAVARQIAETHGGRITYRRALDRTCFIVELPLERSMPGGP